MQPPEPHSARRFTFNWVAYSVYSAFHLGYLCFLIVLHRQYGWSGPVLLLAAFFPPVLWDWWGSPKSFVVQDGVITARWPWGSERCWRVCELAVSAGSPLQFGQSGLWVYQRNFKRAFWVSPYLGDSFELLELIQPGSSEQLKSKSNPKSWWNRELF